MNTPKFYEVLERQNNFFTPICSFERYLCFSTEQAEDTLRTASLAALIQSSIRHETGNEPVQKKTCFCVKYCTLLFLEIWMMYFTEVKFKIA